MLKSQIGVCGFWGINMCHHGIGAEGKEIEYFGRLDFYRLIMLLL
jgi:hypothetical protein